MKCKQVGWSGCFVWNFCFAFSQFESQLLKCHLTDQVWQLIADWRCLVKGDEGRGFERLRERKSLRHMVSWFNSLVRWSKNWTKIFGMRVSQLQLLRGFRCLLKARNQWHLSVGSTPTEAFVSLRNTVWDKARDWTAIYSTFTLILRRLLC